MALCLPRRRRATSLATLPKTLSVASITNHSCVTSAALALKVFMGSDVRFEPLAGSMVGYASRWRALARSLSHPEDRAHFAEADGEKPSSIAAVRPGGAAPAHGAGM